ncbi:retrovirus-related pol polyprotein from transposon TNT 1-94, partial [Tanacetum coccineum]
MEGLGHNLFSMGQFCDSDLEVAFRKHTCFIRDLEGIDLLKGSRGSNLYTLSMENLLLSSPICLLSKASKTKSMRIQSINGRKYILVIVDDYSRFTWVKFLRSKDEVREFVIKFLKMIQVRLNATILPTVIAPVVLTGTPSSTIIDQDAPSTSTSQTNQETPSLVISLNVEEANDIEVAHMGNNPYVYFPTPKPSSEESSSQVIIPDNVHSINQPPKHINKWNKDHPIDNVIGDPSRPVFTQNQLQDEALFYYFDAFLSSVEPMSYKQALTESSWIEVMQEELNEFEHELGGMLKNKACLIARGYRQEEGIDFKESFAPISQLVDPENPNHVYKLKKALYGLKQAPQAWYDLLSSFLLSQNFSKGTVHPTLFIRIEGKDILLYQAKSTEKHLHAVKQIFRYLRGTINIGLWYSKDSCIALTSFADVDYVGCQPREENVVWMYLQQAIRHHFIKEQVENGVVEMYFVRTEYQVAGVFTKPLARERLEFLINKLGMRSMSPKTLKKLANEEEENINPIAAQQVALDNALVAPEKRLKIEKCNMIIEFNKPQREPTFQVTLDVLKLSPCYPAFLITTETIVLEEEPAKKPKRAKHPELAKKSAPKKDVSSKNPSRKQSTSVQIRNNPGVFVSKKKAPAITNISKGIDLLFEAALLEDAQIKKVLKWSKR